MGHTEGRAWAIRSRLILILVASCCGLLPSAGATMQRQRQVRALRFEVGLIGDMPYDARHEREFASVMKALDAADLAFVVHNGDFWWDGNEWTDEAGGRPPCSDEAFQDRLALARRSRHPFVFVAGDNEWTDCHRAKPRPYDPLERLAKLRRMFFPDGQSLGRRTLRLTRQSGDARYASFRENARWVYGDVVFVTLHVVGSNNNLGRTPEMDAEHAERMAANLAWMRQAFDVAVRGGSPAVMIIAQANPRFETSWPAIMQQRYMLAGLGFKSPETRRPTGFDGFLAALEKQTVAFGKPVVYVHGDSHLFRIDKPLVGSSSRRIIENFTRVETFGHPYAHWVRAVVDPRDPGVFTFREEIVPANVVGH